MLDITAALALAILSAAPTAAQTALAAYNADPASVSVSGLSSGGFMAAQLGVAYSSIFPTGFGVFAGGPYDCARNQQYTTCMYNANPSITQPLANMRSWSGNQIDTTANLASKKVYLQVGTSDTTVGPNVMNALNTQIGNFVSASNINYVKTSGAAHTFPTDFSGTGDNACGTAASPYVSNCNYDGAGAVLQWMYAGLTARNNGGLTGTTVSFSQSGVYGAAGMAATGYLYVPAACKTGSTTCKLHVALHGCLQSYGQIGSKFIDNTGYNKWADTNNIIILYPQTQTDSSSHTVWSGTMLPNPNGCWDWVGWYGNNADQKGGVQMVAITNMVKQIIKNFNGTPGNTTPAPTQPTTTFATSTTPATTAPSPLQTKYGQCAGPTWPGPYVCAPGSTCTSYSAQYGQCL